MFKMKGLILILAVCLQVGIPCVSGADALRTANNIDNERFALEYALTGVQNINEWLNSFRALTMLTADRTTLEEKQQVGNLEADMQTIGFYNWVKSVEGTLHKQNYDIRKLEYELAQERCAAGKVSQAEVAEKERRYQEAESNLQDFLAKFHIAD